MADSALKIQANLLRNYYKYFSSIARGKAPDKKIAWVTSFTPVEILEALDIHYCYPESYAAVIAASEKEQGMFVASVKNDLTTDCCCYSCCIEGSLETQTGPRGTMPLPDILIATNNQCSTLPNWWNIIARRYNVPLIIIDYPGARTDKKNAFDYVKKQHTELIAQLERLSGNTLDTDALYNAIQNSRESIKARKRISAALREHNIKLCQVFDDMSFLITSRCKPETATFYNIRADEYEAMPRYADDLIPAFWLGYPLWYHPERHFEELLSGFRIVGANYITWWDLDYAGNDYFEMLYNAYNFTFLNLAQASRNTALLKLINESGARCAVTLRNKSCKCDFVSARDIPIPQAELEIDMIDREFADIEGIRRKIETLREIVCTG